VPKNFAIMIKGKDKMVYWKGCNVTVYETDSKGMSGDQATLLRQPAAQQHVQ